MYLSSCVEFPVESTFLTKRFADILTSQHSHTSSVPLVLSSLAHTDLSMDQCGRYTDGLEMPIRPTTSHLGLDS